MSATDRLSLFDMVDGLRGTLNKKCLNYTDDMDIAMSELTDFMEAVTALAEQHERLLREAQQAGVDTFMHGDALDSFNRSQMAAREALARVQPDRVWNTRV